VLRLIICLATLTACSAPRNAPGTSSGAPDGLGAFETLKSLQGNWVAHPEQGLTYVSYRLASSASVLVEEMTAGQQGMSVPPAMMSVYHLDNGRLVMTHFCGQGNQPRMLADEVGPSRLHFSVMDVTNLPSPDASHMVAVIFVLKDADHFTQEWTNRAAGVDEKWQFDFARSK